MKNNIDELIKSSLEGHEMPYDSSAWNSLEKKINTPKAPINPFKYWFLGIGVVAILGVIFFLFKTEDSAKEKEKNEILILKETEDQTTENEVENNSNASDKTKSIDQENKNDNNNGNETILSSEEEKLDSKVANELKTNSSGESNKNDNYTVPKKEEKEENTISKLSEPSIPTFTNKCLDESIKVPNNNDSPISLIFPSGKKVTVKSNSTENIKLNETGKYKFEIELENKTPLNKSNSFLVFEKPQANLNIEDKINYESGLPIIKAEVETIDETISWKQNKKSHANFSNNSKEADFCFFQKGQFELMVTVVNEKGCSNSESKTIKIEEDYNLLAVNAFDPQSSDSRKNSFMPYALTVRSTAFNLLIIDPSTGELVFQSSDASKAWDGIDKRDGKLVNENKVFIWKVTLATPEKNEKSVYKGTIIRI